MPPSLPTTIGVTASDLVDQQTPDSKGAKIVFVDLDGTLIRGDLFLESILLAVRREPWILLKAVRHVVQGRAAFKRALAEQLMPDLRRVPQREAVIEFLQEQRSLGTRVVLATASDQAVAEEFAHQFGLFDDVLASDGICNLKGKAKLAAIEDYCRRHNAAEFTYLGDAWADLPIWRRAAVGGVVEPSARLLAAVHASCPSTRILECRRPRWRHVIRVLRPQQWVKNVLLLTSLLASHEFTTAKLVAGLWAVLAFCCCASATYLLNDLFDIEADRSHPSKRLRPFAAGDIPVTWGPPLFLALLTLGLLTAAATLPLMFVGYLLLYVLATTLYSLWLKRIVLVDVFVLAGLYTLRIVAGGVATATPVSEWLMALSLFSFTSLAFGKRYIELSQMPADPPAGNRDRGYTATDLNFLGSVGPTSGYMAALVFALYINGETVKHLYPRPGFLWLICPLLLYWVSRFWLFAKRGMLSEDPILFALKDRVSVAVGALILVLATLAARSG